MKIHLTDCRRLGSKVVPNETNTFLIFNNFKNKELLPFVIYADLENILLINTFENNMQKLSKKYISNKHEPFSIALVLLIISKQVMIIPSQILKITLVLITMCVL